MTSPESIGYWQRHQVARLPIPITADQSRRALEQRNSMYPELLGLMPCDHQGDVLDYGCGPGHDTIMFLENGARHVYAADASWYALQMTCARLVAHGLLDRATLMLVGDGGWRPPPVDHVHAAGVIHHLADPVGALTRLKESLRGNDAEIRMMVYNAESAYYRYVHGGDPERFRRAADGGAPIANAWTRAQVERMAGKAGLTARWLGGYQEVGEQASPWLSGCWSLTRSR